MFFLSSPAQRRRVVRGVRPAKARLSIELLEARNLLSTWPLKNGSHQMLTGFADWTPSNIYLFHEGIDILASGKGGEDVVDMRAGTVLWKNADYAGGMVTVKVNLGDGKFEYDHYLHVSPIVAPDVGNAIAEGEDIGKISTTEFAEGSRHLHVDVLNAAPPNDAAPAEDSFLNPFWRFTQNADKDPLGNKPGVEATNKDKDKLLVVRNESFDKIAKQTIDGKVDLIAGVRDKMNDTFIGASAPNMIGYYVKALFDKGVTKHDVRTKADPYILATFNDNWFAGKPFTNGKFPAVYADDGKFYVDPNPTQFSKVLYYIVTNTNGGDGKPASVDKDQHWNTKAKDDAGVSDTDKAANFAGKPDATKNAEARFKDGEYEVHIISQDLVNPPVDEVVGKLRVSNFSRPGNADLGGGPSPDGTPKQLYDPDDTPYVPELVPTPSFPSTFSGIYFIGDTIGIYGDGFYPNLLMYAYIFRHRDQGWMEGDPLDGYISQIVVQSDAEGHVPLTQAWVASAPGHYDVLIDYDNNGKFSWTLDGLGGFGVIPPTGAGFVPGVSLNLFSYGSSPFGTPYQVDWSLVAPLQTTVSLSIRASSSQTVSVQYAVPVEMICDLRFAICDCRGIPGTAFPASLVPDRGKIFHRVDAADAYFVGLSLRDDLDTQDLFRFAG